MYIHSSIRAHVLTLALCLICVSGLSALGCTTGKEQETEEKLSKIQNAEYHYKLAGGFFENHEIPQAIAQLTIALEKDPDHVQARYLLGYIYMGRREYTKAINHFKHALRVEPKFFDARNALGATYLAMERWRDAADQFNKLLDEPMYTSPELAHNNLGWAQYNLRDYPEALEHFKMATFLKPEFCLGHNNMGLAYDAMRDKSRAIKHFRKAIELCPNNYAEPHFNLGRIFQSRGEAQVARRHFQRCSNLADDSTLGERCRQYLSY